MSHTPWSENSDPAHLEGSFLLWQPAVLLHFLWPHDPRQPSLVVLCFVSASSGLQSQTLGASWLKVWSGCWSRLLLPQFSSRCEALARPLSGNCLLPLEGWGVTCPGEGTGLDVIHTPLSHHTLTIVWAGTPTFCLEKLLGSGAWLPVRSPDSAPCPSSH